MTKHQTESDETAALHQRVAFLEGCLGELVTQRDIAAQRAANLAGEVARLRAQGGEENQ